MRLTSKSLAYCLPSRPVPLIPHYSSTRALIRSCRCGCRSNSICSCSCCAHFSPFTIGSRAASSFTSQSVRVFHSRNITTSTTRPKHGIAQPFNSSYLYIRHSRNLATMAQEYKLKDIRSLAEIPPFEKRECEVEGIQDGTVLVIKYDGEVHCLSPRCTHYGAPLKMGVVAPNGRITCPWHGGMSPIFLSD